MDKGADCVIACLDAQNQARVALREPLSVVVREWNFLSISCIRVQVNANNERLAFDKARSRKRRRGWPSALSSNNNPPSRTMALVSKVMRPLAMRTIKVGEQL